MAAARYPSPEWFAATDALPGDTKPDLVVEHQCEAAGGETLTHQQAFCNGRIASWSPGAPFGQPHLTLKRSLTNDAGDLLGLSTAACTAANTAIEIDGVVSGVFGFEGFDRNGIVEMTGHLLPVDFCVTALDSPFGDAEAALRLYANGRIKTFAAGDAEADLTVRGTWEDLVQQSFNEEHLMWLMAEKRLKVTGDFYLLSYLNGFLAWPKTTAERQWAQQFHSLMSEYRQCRKHPQYRQDLERLAQLHSPQSPPSSSSRNSRTSRESVKT